MVLDDSCLALHVFLYKLLNLVSLDGVLPHLVLSVEIVVILVLGVTCEPFKVLRAGELPLVLLVDFSVQLIFHSLISLVQFKRVHWRVVSW